jgi:4-methylaminobutanoate oxidase (formaldehyde-forming)
MLFHNEPVWRDGRLVGRITSAMYGHTLGQALGMGYVEADEGVTNEYVASGRFEIEIACRRVPAVASLQAFYDPTHVRVRDARPLSTYGSVLQDFHLAKPKDSRLASSRASER